MSAEKIENRLRLAIVAVVGLAAGAASFTHVHDWTMSNSPVGTPGWFGWANACISELVPIAALLTIRSNRRSGKPIGFPVAMLLGAAGFSLSAQLAVAKPSASGWLLSAIPAVAFMLLVKLVLAGLPTGEAVPMPIPTMPMPAPVVPMPTPVVPAQEAMPIATPEPRAETAKVSKPRNRQHVVPAHPERADSASRTDAEILAAFEAMRADGKKLADIADALGISTRKLFNIRKAVSA